MPKPSIQARLGDVEKHVAEIREIDIERGFGMGLQIMRAQHLMLGGVACDVFGAGLQRQARMGKRIALRARLADQQRGGGILAQRASVEMRLIG